MIKEFFCDGRYHLLICISGMVVMKNKAGKTFQLLPEQAVFWGAGTKSYRVSNNESETLIFLRAVPVGKNIKASS